jgi:hypothetical protein
MFDCLIVATGDESKPPIKLKPDIVEPIDTNIIKLINTYLWVKY